MIEDGCERQRQWILNIFVAMHLCICILHFLHTLVFALCIFITNLYLYLYLWESLVVSNRSRGFLAVFVSSLWSTLPRAHSRRSRFILPDFDFIIWFYSSSRILILILFLMKYIWHRVLTQDTGQQSSTFTWWYLHKESPLLKSGLFKWALPK